MELGMALPILVESVSMWLRVRALWKPWQRERWFRWTLGWLEAHLRAGSARQCRDHRWPRPGNPAGWTGSYPGGEGPHPNLLQEGRGPADGSWQAGRAP